MPDRRSKPLSHAEAERALARVVATLLWALLAGAGAASLMSALTRLAPLSAAQIGAAILALSPKPLTALAIGLMGEKSLTDLMAKFPSSLSFVIVAGVCLKWNFPARIATDLLLPPVDGELFHAIPHGDRDDPLWAPALGHDDIETRPIAWTAPPAPAPDEPPTPRRQVWESLIRFVAEDIGNSPHTLLGLRVRPQEPFRWALVTGQAGSGKTRMIKELALARARADLLERDPPVPDAQSLRAHRRARRKLRRGAASRRTIPWKKREDHAEAPTRDARLWHGCDPWDAFWLVAATNPAAPAHARRAGFDSALLKRLAAWRPHMPTILLLDDPLDGDARRIVDSLLEGSAQYRHPVRLIIANQSLPRDLGIEKTASGWRAAPRGFAGAPLRLDGEARIGPAEIRIFSGELQAMLDAQYRHKPAARRPIGWRPNAASVETLLRRTAGNALLACLALYHLYRHPTRGDISRETILRDRAERIREALLAAGVSEPQLRLIALATLIGPAAPFPPALLTDATRFDPHLLHSIPNLLAQTPPAPPLVVPAPIGDTFIRLVLSDMHCAPDHRAAILAEAWRAAPTPMLRTAWRLSTGEDALAIALRAGPAQSGLDEARIALAYAAWAALIPREEWDLGDVPGPAPAPPLPGGYTDAAMDFAAESARFAALRQRSAAAEAEATRRLAALPPATAMALLPDLVALMETPASTAILRSNTALELFVTAASAARPSREPPLAPEAAANLADLIATALQNLHPTPNTREAPRQAAIFAAVITDAAAAFGPGGAERARLETIVRAVGNSSGLRPGFLFAIATALASTVAPCGAIGAALAHRLRGFACPVGDDTTATQEARAVDRIAAPFRGERAFELIRARAWRSVAYVRTDDPKACEAAAEEVNAIASRFPADRDFDLQRAVTRRYVAHARVADRAACEAAAHRVDEIARDHPGDADFERERAQAWRCVAFAHDGNAGECEAAARHVDAIAQPFAGSRDFEAERAQAWRSVAFSHRHAPVACAEAARAVDNIVRPFPGDRDFEAERAEAWSLVAFARDKEPATCETAARLVDDIARPFSGDWDFERARARAWSSVARVRMDMAEACEAATHLVEDFASPFPNDENFELERANAWCAVAFARRKDPAALQNAVRQVEAIADRFPDHPGIAVKRDEARRILTDMSRTTPPPPQPPPHPSPSS